MNSQLLTKEVHYFYKRLFHKEAPAKVASEYVRAHEFCCFDTSPTINLALIIEQNLDCEAIEFAIRGKKTVLSKKMLLVIYLAEMSQSDRIHFFSSKDSTIKGYTSLLYHSARTALLALKGLFLVKRYRLV